MSDAASKIAPAVTTEMKSPADVVKDDEEMVTCTVPRSFRITTDQHVQVEVPVGVQELPESIANHWYAKAHGVVPYVPEKRVGRPPKKVDADPSADTKADPAAQTDPK